MFEHLKSRDIASRTSHLPLPEVSPNAVVELRPAGEANAAYQNAMLRKQGNRLRPGARSNIRVSDIEQSRDEDRALYARHVLVSWSGIEDKDGNQVPFSLDAASEFCAVLPAWIFDRIRVHAMQPENFLDRDEDPAPDAGAIAGN